MLRMVSYPHRPQSGHIMCYLHRTYHVLPTLRLRSLADAWYSDYPTLLSFVDLLKGRPACFSLDNISDDDCLNLCVKLHEQKIEPKDDLSRAALNLVDTGLTCGDFRRAL